MQNPTNFTVDLASLLPHRQRLSIVGHALRKPTPGVGEFASVLLQGQEKPLATGGNSVRSRLCKHFGHFVQAVDCVWFIHPHRRVDYPCETTAGRYVERCCCRKRPSRVLQHSLPRRSSALILWRVHPTGSTPCHSPSLTPAWSHATWSPAAWSPAAWSVVVLVYENSPMLKHLMLVLTPVVTTPILFHVFLSGRYCARTQQRPFSRPLRGSRSRRRRQRTGRARMGPASPIRPGRAIQ